MIDQKERGPVMHANRVARGRQNVTEKGPRAEDVYTLAIHATMDLGKAGESASE
jgi:hypothetical protein